MANRYALVLNGTTIQELQSGDALIGLTASTALVKGDGATGITAATAGTDYGAPATASTWSASQRGTVTTANTGSFDMSVTNNFKCTPTGTFALTFTNITAGQSGYVLLVNTGGYAVTAAATTKVNKGNHVWLLDKKSSLSSHQT